MWLLWAGGALVGVLLLLLLVLWLLGRGIPEAHVMSVTLHLGKTREEVFAVLADSAGIPTWDQGVDRVERLADRGGHEVWRWTMGRNAMVLETTRCEAPAVLVRTIADDAKIFSGDWTYELSAEGGGCSLLLTEHGRVHVAIPRAMMKYVPAIADPAMYLRRHLERLAGKFGEPPRIEIGRFRTGE